MEARTVFLKSYDRFAEILEYDLPSGTFAVLPREDFESRGIPSSFGWFSREGDHVAGISASAEGPVLFLDGRWLVGRFGSTSAVAETLPDSATSMYTLVHDGGAHGKTVFHLAYQARLGIGTNPYDNEREDVDLFALIASSLKQQRFFAHYTRPS